jgi:hypothetical protein
LSCIQDFADLGVSETFSWISSTNPLLAQCLLNALTAIAPSDDQAVARLQDILTHALFGSIDAAIAELELQRALELFNLVHIPSAATHLDRSLTAFSNAVLSVANDTSASWENKALSSFLGHASPVLVERFDAIHSAAKARQFIDNPEALLTKLDSPTLIGDLFLASMEDNVHFVERIFATARHLVAANRFSELTTFLQHPRTRPFVQWIFLSCFGYCKSDLSAARALIDACFPLLPQTSEDEVLDFGCHNLIFQTKLAEWCRAQLTAASTTTRTPTLDSALVDEQVNELLERLFTNSTADQPDSVLRILLNHIPLARVHDSELMGLLQQLPTPATESTQAELKTNDIVIFHMFCAIKQVISAITMCTMDQRYAHTCELLKVQAFPVRQTYTPTFIVDPKNTHPRYDWPWMKRAII